MRRLVVALLGLTALLTIAYSLVAVDARTSQALRRAPDTVGRPFVIPDVPRLKDDRVVFESITAAGLASQANVIRTVTRVDSTGDEVTTIYVLLTGQSELPGLMPLRAGRWLSPADRNRNDAFLSTSLPERPEQVGTLQDFAGGSEQVLVRPWVAQMDAPGMSPAGLYRVEVGGTTEGFLTSLADNLNHRLGGDTVLTADDLRHKGAVGAASDASPVAGWLGLASGLSALLSALLLAYSVMRDAHTAAIRSLHGHPRVAHWFASAGRLILVTSGGACVGAGAVALTIRDPQPAFPILAWSLLSAQALMAGAVAGIGAWIASGIPIPEALKGREVTWPLLVGNSLAKAACGIAAVVVAGGVLSAGTVIAADQRRLDLWQSTETFGVFHPVRTGNDAEAIRQGRSPDAQVAQSLYPILCSQGALYADARPLGPRVGLPAGAPQSITRPAMRVNPNYLKHFPILDVAGRPVVISESETAWVILAPRTMASDEAGIRGQFQASRTGPNGALDADRRRSGLPTPEPLLNQRVTITWTSPGQRVFTMDPAIGSAEGNVIEDPIVEVMTLANSVGIDREASVGRAGSSALKVRLSEGGGPATREAMVATLRDLRLDDNLVRVVSMKEYFAELIGQMRREQHLLVVAGTVLLLGTALLAKQSSSILCAHYEPRVVVRTMHGFAFHERYREVLTWSGVSWGIQVAAGVALLLASGPPAVGRSRASGIDPGMAISAGVVVLAVEASVACLVLWAAERRRVVSALKGAST